MNETIGMGVSLGEFYQVQLHWVQEMQQALRSVWMDQWFVLWNAVDSTGFSLIIIVLAWYLWKREIGIRLFYIFLIGLMINFSLKTWFAQPRPCQIDPDVGLICLSSYGFPSGGAQTATLLCGVVFAETQRVRWRVLAVLFALMLCFSRLYLGVHYVSDVLGGILCGLVLVYLYRKGGAWIAPYRKALMWFFPFLFVGPGYVIGLSWEEILGWMLSAWGVALGISRAPQRKEWPGALVRCATVLGGLGVVLLLQAAFAPLWWLWAFFKGFWLSDLGAHAAERLFLRKK